MKFLLIYKQLWYPQTSKYVVPSLAMMEWVDSKLTLNVWDNTSHRIIFSSDSTTWMYSGMAKFYFTSFLSEIYGAIPSLLFANNYVLFGTIGVINELISHFHTRNQWIKTATRVLVTKSLLQQGDKADNWFKTVSSSSRILTLGD